MRNHDLELDPATATLEELADDLDQQAEDRNYHEFVGVHRALASLIYNVTDRDTTTHIMRQIYELGGLDRWDAVDNKDVYKKLGVPVPWDDWSLSC